MAPISHPRRRKQVQESRGIGFTFFVKSSSPGCVGCSTMPARPTQGGGASAHANTHEMKARRETLRASGRRRGALSNHGKANLGDGNLQCGPNISRPGGPLMEIARISQCAGSCLLAELRPARNMPEGFFAGAGAQYLRPPSESHAWRSMLEAIWSRPGAPKP